jgi:hypothetical protein
MKIKYLICLFLLLSIAGCTQSTGKDRALQGKALMEEVLSADLDKDEIGLMPAHCATDLIYDLCQEVKRLRVK